MGMWCSHWELLGLRWQRGGSTLEWLEGIQAVVLHKVCLGSDHALLSKPCFCCLQPPSWRSCRTWPHSRLSLCPS